MPKRSRSRSTIRLPITRVLSSSQNSSQKLRGGWGPPCRVLTKSSAKATRAARGGKP